MRRTFAAALARSHDPSLETYAAHDGLQERLLDMTGPIPETLEDTFD
jgi:hypothetical protein